MPERRIEGRNMRTRIHKLFLVSQMEQEEKWLNDKAEQGYLVSQVGKFSYLFDKVEAHQYCVKLLMMSGSKNSEKNRKYFRFLEEMGIDYVDGMNFPFVSQVYLKMKKEDAPAQMEFFSDMESKVKYNRLVMAYLVFAIIVMALLTGLNYHMGMRQENSFRMINYFLAGVLIGLIIMVSFEIVRLLLVNHKLKKERRIHE